MSTPATQVHTALAVPGINVLLMGMPGSGKTHAIRTLVEAGLEVFVIFTEPGMEVLADVPSDKLHWHYVQPATAGWEALLDNAKKINTLTNDALQKLPNIKAKDYTQMMEVLQTCQNFTDDRTGKEFGDVTTWGTDRALVVDSLTGVNIMSMDLTVGSKPVKTLVDWGVAMDMEERLLNQLTLGTTCHFVLTAHMERQTDEVMGGIKTMPLALGRKLGPTIGRFFSDVVMCERTDQGWFWSTASGTADLKARNLDWKAGQPPSFVPLIDNWKKTQEQ